MLSCPVYTEICNMFVVYPKVITIVCWHNISSIALWIELLKNCSMQARETYPSHQQAAEIDNAVALTSHERKHIIIALSTSPINC
jgi:hypothetical protein